MSRIAIVDGSLLDRGRMATILEAGGHQVVEWYTGRQAMVDLAVVPRGYIDLAIIELRLPDMDGLELLAWFKGQVNVGGVPVVIVSPHTDREQIIQVIESGGENIVAKPFASDVFLRRVNDILHQYQVVRQGEAGEVAWNVRDYLIRELKRAERSKRPLSLIIGRVEGGARDMATLMAGLGRNLRGSDTLSRLGADLLMVVLPDTDEIGARVVEAKVWHAVSRAVADSPLHAQLRLCTGAATYPEDGISVDTLLAAAKERAHAVTPQT